jgi:hypothetical protein
VEGHHQDPLPRGAALHADRRAPFGGHGLSVDLLIVDELYGCSAESIEDGMIPTQRARRDPLMSCWSTAGTE